VLKKEKSGSKHQDYHSETTTKNFKQQASFQNFALNN